MFFSSSFIYGMSQRQRYVLTIVGLSCLVLVWWFFCYQPLSRKIKKLVQQIDESRDNSLDEVAEMSFLRNRVGREDAMTTILNLAKDCIIVSLGNQYSVGGEHRIILACEGTAENLIAFVYAIECDICSLSINQCQMRRLDDTNISATMVITW